MATSVIALSSSRESSRWAACAESVTLSGRLAPGIGITVGPSASSQASATCCGETSCASAALATGSTSAVPPALPMPPSGDQGRNAIPRSLQKSTSPLISGDVKSSDSWFWTETISATSSASSSWSRLQLERPIQRTLPSSWSSLNAPTVSA